MPVRQMRYARNIFLSGKTVKDIKVTVLDENYEEQGEETLPSGSNILPVRTDMKTYIDCSLDDGKLIRLKYDSNGYPAMINGESWIYVLQNSNIKFIL